MPSMNRVSSVKISRGFISHDGRPDVGNSAVQGFTLLELIVSMTIISMVVVVLYFAFSTGVRSWDSDVIHGESEIRLEAILRLFEDDLQNTVQYNMNWERGPLSLFAGGPGSVFYVTGNGTGAFSGAGAGLFFSILYVDDCPETSEDCLFLYKSPRPSPEYIRAVDEFRGSSEFQRERFAPGTEIAEKSLLILTGIENMNISYSDEKFVPFAGIEHDYQDSFSRDEDLLPEEHWIREELPGRARVAFSAEGRDFVVQVPVQ